MIMKYELAEIVYAGLYVILLTGIAILFRKDIKALIWRIKMTRRLKSRQKQTQESALANHLDMLVKITVGRRFTGNHLMIMSGIIFAGVLLPGLRSYRVLTAVFFALIIAIMPYFLLRIRLENTRHAASFEGEVFVAALLSKYRMTSFNMQRALEMLIEDDKMPELCKRFLTPAIMKARMTGDKEKIQRAFAEFNFAVNTNWSRMASYNIALAFSTGLDVTTALEDIMIQLREARSITEERKRLNSEANRLVMFMVPAAYLMSMLLAVKYVGVSFRSLLRNQFLTQQGFALFVFILFMFLLNTALLKMLENKRFDY